MTVYKIKNDVDNQHAGRIIVKHGGEYILMATPVKGTLFIGNWTAQSLIQSGKTDMVSLEDEKWVHPHLLKKVRKKFVQEQTK